MSEKLNNTQVKTKVVSHTDRVRKAAKIILESTDRINRTVRKLKKKTVASYRKKSKKTKKDKSLLSK